MAIDILLDDDDDLWIENNDVKIGRSEEQEIARIVKALPGHFRNAPILGAGLGRHYKTHAAPEDIKKSIDTHLLLDNFKKSSVVFEKDNNGRDTNKVIDIGGKRDE